MTTEGHDDLQPPHRRRPRYSGKNPRRFEDKYKELNPEKYPEIAAKVQATGKTPAGSHVAVLVTETLAILNPQPGEKVVDCTLGYGCHAQAILRKIAPGGQLLGLDVDPIEQPKTEARLRALGYGPEVLLVQRCNFAGLSRAMAQVSWQGVDCLMADLGVSSMQIDNPSRGFSVKQSGPLDMRMNPLRGVSAAQLLKRINPVALTEILQENADEPYARVLAEGLAGQPVDDTKELAHRIRSLLSFLASNDQELSIRRVFQALRIEVNEEFSTLEMLLRHLPECLNPGGRVVFLTFHSGEDRRVKKSFQAGHREGIYADVVRASEGECRANPRSRAAKLRWAIRS